MVVPNPEPLVEVKLGDAQLDSYVYSSNDCMSEQFPRPPWTGFMTTDASVHPTKTTQKKMTRAAFRHIFILFVGLSLLVVSNECRAGGTTPPTFSPSHTPSHTPSKTPSRAPTKYPTTSTPTSVPENVGTVRLGNDFVFVVSSPDNTLTFTSETSGVLGTLYHVNNLGECNPDSPVIENEEYSRTTLQNGTELYMFCYDADSIDETNIDVYQYFQTTWELLSIHITNPISLWCQTTDSCKQTGYENETIVLSSPIQVMDTFEFRDYAFVLSGKPSHGTIKLANNQIAEIGNVLTFPLTYVPDGCYFNAGADGVSPNNLIGNGINGCEPNVICPDAMQFVIYPIDHPELVTSEVFSFKFFVAHVLTEWAPIQVLNEADLPDTIDAMSALNVQIYLDDKDSDLEYALIQLSITESMGYVFFDNVVREDYTNVDFLNVLTCTSIPELSSCDSIAIWGLPGKLNSYLLGNTTIVGVRSGTLALKIQYWKPGTGNQTNLAVMETTPANTKTVYIKILATNTKIVYRYGTSLFSLLIILSIGTLLFAPGVQESRKQKRDDHPQHTH